VYANIPVERVAEYVRRLADGNVREKVAAVRRLVYGVRCRVFFSMTSYGLEMLEKYYLTW